MSIRFSQSLTPGLFAGLCALGLAVGVLEPLFIAGDIDADISVPHPLFGLVSVVYTYRLWRADSAHPAGAWASAKTALKALIWPLSLPWHFIQSFGWAKGLREVACLFATALLFAVFQVLGLLIAFRFLLPGWGFTP